MHKLTAAALVIATAFAATSAAHAGVEIRYGGSISGLSQALDVEWNGANMSTPAGLLTFETRGGDSFEAFCIELAQQVSTRYLNYGVSQFSGTQSTLLQGLFSSSYATVDTSIERSAFQLAIWELTHETRSSQWSITDGSKQSFNLDSDSRSYAPLGELRSLTSGYLTAAAGYTGADLYSLERLSHSSAQDLLRFSAVSPANLVNAVPEPSSYALLAAGLGALGFVTRRRRARD